MIEIRQYVDRRGRNPFEKWFDSLDANVQARITVALDRLERGNTSTAKSIAEGIHEIRLDFGPGYRIYFGWDGEKLVILVGGGSKRRQQQDILAAQAAWHEYKARKQEA